MWNFSGGCFMWHRLAGFFDVAFDPPCFCNLPFCGGRFCKTSIVCITCGCRWFTCTNPMKLSCFISSPSTSCTCEQSLIFLFNTNGYWFSSFIPFALSAKSINDLTIYLGGILTIHGLVPLFCLSELGHYKCNSSKSTSVRKQ